VRSRVAAIVVAIAATSILAGCGSSPPALVSLGLGISGRKGLHAVPYAYGPAKIAALAFDSRNRLWLATADYTDQGHDGLYLVAKRDAKPVEVVAHLHTPLGLVWKGNTLYVASTGRVDAFSDLRGTTFATRRKIVSLPAHVGESNNLVLAPNGRLLLGISAPCDHCTPKSKYSGAIVSFRPDGGDLRVYAGGIRAPVGLAFFPGSENLLVSMNQRDDLGSRTPGDWLSVVNSGDDWKFPDCYGQGGTVCAGVPQPLSVLDKHAAAAGVAIVTGQLGSGIGTSALVAEWAKNTVLQVPLDKSGTKSRGKATPLLTGIANPVAMTVTPLDSLLVGNWTTGVIYEISATNRAFTLRTSSP
jgi:glucose/arabinose dehydrogenase